jgi:hypothetical protein
MNAYQSAVVVTPHATNPNEYRALFLVPTGATPSVTITPRGSGSVTIPLVDGGDPVLLPVETRLVTAATNATVIGLN